MALCCDCGKIFQASSPFFVRCEFCAGRLDIIDQISDFVAQNISMEYAFCTNIDELLNAIRKCVLQKNVEQTLDAV